MNLLNSVLYDPGTAVSKATSSLLALTAFDTTNLRMAVTVPSHGKIRFRMRCAAVGATTMPTVLLGVLNGSTVVGRIVPTWFPGTMSGSTVSGFYEADFTVGGLTPGAMNFDAAYAVQVVVSSTNIKYGGPNNASGANAWGGFLFEVWDPQPFQTNGQIVVDSSGRLDISKVAGTAQTARDLGANLDAAVSSRMATFTLPANFSSLAIDASGRVDLGKILGVASAGAAGYVGLDWGHVNAPTTAVNLSGTTISTSQAVASVSGAVGSVTGRVTANTDQLAGQAVSAAAGVTFPSSIASPTNITAGTITTVTNLTNAPTAGDLTAAMKASVTAAVWDATMASHITAGTTGAALNAAGSSGDPWATSLPASYAAGTAGYIIGHNLDAQVSTRSAPGDVMKVSSGTGANQINLSAGAVALQTDQAVNVTKVAGTIQTARDLGAQLDAAVSTRLASASYVAPDNADIAAIKAKTDSLTFTIANQVDANTRSINGTRVNGNGSTATPWGP